MRILAKEKLSEHKFKDNNGYLICTDCILSRTGKQTYHRDEVFKDGSDEEVEVDRIEDEVFSNEALASFENCPVCINHPDCDVTPDNHSELSVGFVRNVRKGDYEGQPVMMGDLVITDAKAIDLIESGEMGELSCGYDCDISDEENPQQRNIRGNHVALCEQGRAGIAKIVDSIDDSINDSIASDVVKLIKGMNRGFKLIHQLVYIDNRYSSRVSRLQFTSDQVNDENAKNVENQVKYLLKSKLKIDTSLWSRSDVTASVMLSDFRKPKQSELSIEIFEKINVGDSVDDSEFNDSVASDTIGIIKNLNKGFKLDRQFAKVDDNMRHSYLQFITNKLDEYNFRNTEKQINYLLQSKLVRKSGADITVSLSRSRINVREYVLVIHIFEKINTGDSIDDDMYIITATNTSGMYINNKGIGEYTHYSNAKRFSKQEAEAKVNVMNRSKGSYNWTIEKVNDSIEDNVIDFKSLKERLQKAKNRQELRTVLAEVEAHKDDKLLTPSEYNELIKFANSLHDSIQRNKIMNIINAIHGVN